MKKVIIFDNIFQMHQLSLVLETMKIEFRVHSYHDTAYNGIIQYQKGWGYLEANEEDELMIQQLYQELISSETGDDFLQDDQQ